MTQAFTYYPRTGPPEVRVQPKGPLPKPGEVWVRGRYIGPDQPSPLNVRVGTAGIKAWMVILWLRLSDDNKDRLLEGYSAVLKPEDIDSALWFYEINRPEIDQKIEEEMQPAQ